MEREGELPLENSVEVADYQDAEPAKFESENRHFNESEFVEKSASQLAHLLTDGERIDKSPSRESFAMSLSEQLLYSRAQQVIREKSIADSVDAPDLEPADRYEALRNANSSLEGTANEVSQHQPDTERLVGLVSYRPAFYDVLLGRALLGDEKSEKDLIAVALTRDDMEKNKAEWDALPPDQQYKNYMGMPQPVSTLREPRKFTGEETLGGKGFAIPVPEILKNVLTEHLNEINLANLAHQRDRAAIESGSSQRLFTSETAGQRLFSLLTEANGFTNVDGVIVPAAMEEDEAKRYAAAFVAYEEHFSHNEQAERESKEAERLEMIAQLEGMIATYESAPQIEQEARTLANQLQEARSRVEHLENRLKTAEQEERAASRALDSAGFFGKGRARRDHDSAFDELNAAQTELNDAQNRVAELTEQDKLTDEKVRAARMVRSGHPNGPIQPQRDLERHRATRWLPENEETNSSS